MTGKWLQCCFPFFYTIGRITIFAPNLIAYEPFEAACLFLIGLTVGKHPVLTKALCVGIVGAPIVYWFVLLVFCKKSKYRKK